MVVLGIRNGSFIEKETGKTIVFQQLHCSYDEDNTFGQAVEVLKIPLDLHQFVKDNIDVGSEIGVAYNKYGKVSDISVK
jgi:hypothetical protein